MWFLKQAPRIALSFKEISAISLAQHYATIYAKEQIFSFSNLLNLWRLSLLPVILSYPSSHAAHDPFIAGKFCTVFCGCCASNKIIIIIRNGFGRVKLYILFSGCLRSRTHQVLQSNTQSIINCAYETHEYECD